MRVTKSLDASRGPVDARHFDGSVSRQDYGEIPSPEGTALLVSFPAGARTHWHSHPEGQVLFIVDGVGRVGTRAAPPVEIRAGDLVHAPRGEEHWHGASESEPMRHLALSFGATTWLEPVDD